jgi:Uma2 family endonuclease
MSMPRSRPLATVDEYLLLERAADSRHEYLDGQVCAMAGESLAHGDITVNLVGMFYVQLKGTPCRALTKDTKVRSGPTPMPARSNQGLFSYPDIVVICGEPEYHDAYRDVILNPTTIVEVLSPATEGFDRGEKLQRYQTCNPTLTDYLLVSQDRPEVEHHHRQADGAWSCRRYTGLEASVPLPAIRCTLPLADVYDRVRFAQGS